MQLINPSTSPNELNTTPTPHSIINGDACFAYFNKIWGIPEPVRSGHRTLILRTREDRVGTMNYFVYEIGRAHV